MITKVTLKRNYKSQRNLIRSRKLQRSIFQFHINDNNQKDLNFALIKRDTTLKRYVFFL